MAWAPLHAAAAAQAAAEAGGDDADAWADALPEGILSHRNGDGVLTEDEVMPGIFSLLDANGNGRAEQREIRGFLAR